MKHVFKNNHIIPQGIASQILFSRADMNSQGFLFNNRGEMFRNPRERVEDGEDLLQLTKPVLPL